MGTIRTTETNSSPATTFWVEADLLSQSTAGNYSVVRCYLAAKNGPGGSTASRFAGAGSQSGTIAGVKTFATKSASTNFLPSGYADGATRWRLGPYDVQVPHNSDGTRAPLRFGMVLNYGSNVETIFNPSSLDLALPDIPRASSSTLPTSFDVGTTVTINTNPASTAFRHTLELWEYGVNASAPLATIATGVAASYSWAAALNLAAYFPDETSKKFFLRTRTFSGSSEIGASDTVFTMRAPASMVPTVSAVTVADDNPAVVSAVGVLVQGQSMLKAAVTAAGIYGSTIESTAVSVDGATGAPGEPLPLPASGTRAVSAAVVDSRGRTATRTQNVTVLAYDKPLIPTFSVTRANASGTPTDTGTNLLMTLKATANSLKNGTTEKNKLTITVATRARGTSAWTNRNSITAALAYDQTVLITGGSVFSAGSAWEVRVTVADVLQQSVDYFTVSTAGAIVDATDTKQAFGKMVEASGPTTQIAGPGRLYGAWDIDGSLILTASMGLPAQNLGTVHAADLPQAFPQGVSYGQAGDGFPNTIGTVMTVRQSEFRGFQYFFDRSEPARVWFRTFNGYTSWRAFREFITDASPSVPWATAVGLASAPTTIANGSGATVTITFPAGRFTQAPVLTVTPGSSARLTVAILSVSTTSASVRLDNFSGGNASGITPAHWVAVQMTSGSASG